MPSLTGHIVSPQGLQPATLHFGSHIHAVHSASAAQASYYLLPGFIDTHVHGGGGGDTMDGADGVLTLAKTHLQHGTTTLYPTTMTNPWDTILAALQGVQEVQTAQAQAALQEPIAEVAGVHLEGPFISPNRLGAQPPYSLEPNPEQLETLLSFGIIRLVTLAAEVAGAEAAAQCFARAGVRVSLGHSNASYEQCQRIADSVQQAGGTLGFTHLYNAMSGLQGRAPGVLGAAFANAQSYAEIILDGHHLHVGSVRAAYQAKPGHISLISDAIRASALGDGDSELGGQPVTVRQGRAQLADGTLAGSVLTLDQALRHALEADFTLCQASAMLSAVPARYMGLSDRGELSLGKRADIVVLDKAYKLEQVYLAGRACLP